MSGISAGYGLLRALQRRLTQGSDDTQSTGQNVPAGQSRPARFDPAKLFEAMDADKSGSISKDEFLGAARTAGGGDRSLRALIALQASLGDKADSASGTDGSTAKAAAFAAPTPADPVSSEPATDTAAGSPAPTPADPVSSEPPSGTTGTDTSGSTPPGTDTSGTDTTGSDPSGTDTPETTPDTAATRLFKALDTDQDGTVSKDELAAALAALKGRRHGHHHHARHTGAGEGSRLDALFKAIDGDSDGTISKDELTAALGKAQEQWADRRHQFAAAAAQYAKNACATTDASTSTVPSVTDTSAVSTA